MKCHDMPDRVEMTCCEPMEGSGKFRCHVLGYVSRKYIKREEVELLLVDIRKEIEELKEQIKELKKERPK